ncbi:MAG: DUF302 domain-containing protein [Ardenticatenia bacterium]|nr:DUF302 domain-containing protein [Ardenticatenia bacterium]
MATDSPSPLGFNVRLPLPSDEAIARVTEALKAEGFGILTRIDVQATLKEKIGQDFRPYVILGACNPHLAYRALSADSAAGLLLPCNVVVEATEGGSLVRIVNPDAMMGVPGMEDQAAIQAVAADARAKLERVAAALG